MKTKLLLIMLVIVSGMAAQNQYLDINQVKAFTTADATNFFVNGGLSEGYEVPKGSGKKCDFSNSLWIGGKDGSGNLNVMAQTYRSNGARLDSWGGPLLSAGPQKGTCPLNGVPGFINTTFKVNKSTIDSFKLAWQNGLVQNGSYTIPSSISNWPGTYIPNPKEVLAPYFDNNNDTNYNPLNGDYPLIKGDQAIFVVYNDMGNVKTASVTAGIGLEVRRLSYAYNCPNVSASTQVLNYTTFHEYTIINKGNSTLDSLFCGMWTETNLGGANDDYIGCDIGREVGYIYNGDNFDASLAGYTGYFNNTPIFAYKLFRTAANDGVDSDNDSLIDEADEMLVREMNGFTYFDNTGQGSIFYSDPLNGTEYYRYLTNRFRGGSNLIYGGNGISNNGGVNIPTRFCYPGSSDPLNLGTNGVVPINIIAGGWSETNNGFGVPNFPSDRRFILNARAKKLIPGQVIKFNMALIFTPNPFAQPFANLLPTAQQDWDIIDSMYVNNAFPNTCSTVSGIYKNRINQTILLSGFPNPAKDEFIITGFSGAEKNISITISDVNGKLIQALKQDLTNETIRIDLQNYENGIYFIKVNGEQILKVIKAE